jgi:DNA/RNA-binding domain of Phe-tRNA-synthetase-like protein
MHFAHADAVWRDYPELVAGVIVVDGIDAGARVDAPVADFTAAAESRLAAGPESGLVEIQAWRSAFARMGLKPTQYRCAAEALLRRYRKEGSLPRIHPLVDLCNAVSLAFAIPVAALDRARIAGFAEVRYATGTELYLTFAGETEHPEPGEVIYADAEDRAHARRWTNRQSGYSAVGEETSEVLIAAEAMHDSAVEDIPWLIDALAAALAAAWSTSPTTAFPTAMSPRVWV